MGKRAASKRKAILERKISEDRPQKPSPPPVDPGGKVYVPVAIALITFPTIVT